MAARGGRRRGLAQRHRHTAPRLLRQGDPAALLAAEPELLDDESPGAFRDFLGAIRPELRSGEDLPGYLPGEVEIARLRYTRTVHQEVTAVRARPDGDGIAYRVVDEYLTEYNCDPDWSAAPLTLGELIDLVDGVPYGEPRGRGLYFGDLWYRVRDEEMIAGELAEPPPSLSSRALVAGRAW